MEIREEWQRLVHLPLERGCLVASLQRQVLSGNAQDDIDQSCVFALAGCLQQSM